MRSAEEWMNRRTGRRVWCGVKRGSEEMAMAAVARVAAIADSQEGVSFRWCERAPIANAPFPSCPRPECSKPTRPWPPLVGPTRPRFVFFLRPVFVYQACHPSCWLERYSPASFLLLPISWGLCPWKNSSSRRSNSSRRTVWTTELDQTKRKTAGTGRWVSSPIGRHPYTRT